MNFVVLAGLLLPFLVSAFIKTSPLGHASADYFELNEATISTLRVTELSFSGVDFSQSDWELLKTFAKSGRNFENCTAVREAGLPSGIYSILGVKEECLITETSSYIKIFHVNPSRHFIPNKLVIPFHFWNTYHSQGSADDDSSIFISKRIYTTPVLDSKLVLTSPTNQTVVSQVSHTFSKPIGMIMRDYELKITGTYVSGSQAFGEGIIYDNGENVVVGFYERSPAHTHHIVYLKLSQSMDQKDSSEFLCLEPHYNMADGRCDLYIANEGALPGSCAHRERKIDGTTNHPTQCGFETSRDVLAEVFLQN